MWLVGPLRDSVLRETLEGDTEESVVRFTLKAVTIDRVVQDSCCYRKDCESLTYVQLTIKVSVSCLKYRFSCVSQRDGQQAAAKSLSVFLYKVVLYSTAVCLSALFRNAIA